MSRKIVILPEDFRGPWSAEFACPMTVYLPDNSRKLAVLVTDPAANIPRDGEVYELGPLDTLAGVLSRAGVSRTPPPPPPRVIVIPPPVVIPEVVIPEPINLPPSEDITDPPEVNPVLVVDKPSLFKRIKSFFKS